MHIGRGYIVRFEHSSAPACFTSSVAGPVRPWGWTTTKGRQSQDRPDNPPCWRARSRHFTWIPYSIRIANHNISNQSTEPKGMSHKYDGKARDSISFQMLSSALSFYGENDNMIKIVKIIGKNCLASICNSHLIHCRKKDCPWTFPSLQPGLLDFWFSLLLRLHQALYWYWLKLWLMFYLLYFLHI